MTAPQPTSIVTPDGTDGGGPRHWRPGESVGFILDSPDTGIITGAEFLLATADGGTLVAGVNFSQTGLNIQGPNTVTVYHTFTAAEIAALTAWGSTFYCWGQTSSGNVFDGNYKRGANGLTVVNTAPAANEGAMTPTGGAVVSTTPTISATFTDSDNDKIVKYQLIIETSGGAPVYDSGEQAVAAFAGVAFTVNPPTTFASGSGYRWRMRVWDELNLPSAYSTNHGFNCDSSGGGGGGTGGGGGGGGVIVGGQPQEDPAFVPTPQGSVTVPGSSYTFQATDRFLYIGVAFVQTKVYSGSTLVWDSGLVNYAGGSGNVSISGPQLAAGTTYSWTMTVKDSGSGIVTTSLRSFTGSISTAGNVAPTVSIVSPVGAVVGPTPSFVANFADSGATFTSFSSYQIEVRDISGTPVSRWLSSVIATNSSEKANKQLSINYGDTARQSVTASPLTVPGTYDWRVQVFDDGGMSSGWSARQTFDLQASGPGAPTSLAPTGLVDALTVTFSGTYNADLCTSPIALTTIEVYNGTVLLFTRTFASASNNWSLPYDGALFVPGTVLTWRARNIAADGLVGTMSSFVTITLKSVPLAPTNLAPVTTIGTVFPNGVAPTFSGDHQSANSVAMDYSEVQVTYSDGTKWISSQAESGTRFRIPYTGRNLNNGEKVTWAARTRASDSGYWGPLCATQSLTINNPPIAPNSLTPSGGANIVAASTSLVWTADLGDSVSRSGAGPVDGQSQVFFDLDLIDATNGVSVAGYPFVWAEIFDTFDSAITGWTAVNGTWVSSGGYATSTSAARSILHRDPGGSNYHFGAFLTPVSGKAIGFVFRYADVNNFLSVVLDGYLLKVQKTIANVTTTIRTISVDYTNSMFQHLDVILSGTSYTVTLNGVTLSTDTISDAAVDSSRSLGLYADSAATAQFNDFYCNSDPQTSSYLIPSIDLNAETSYAWTVRSYDGYSYGPWSPQALFQNVDAPVVEITNPAHLALLSAPNPTVTWTYSSTGGRVQQQFAVRIMQGNAVTYDSGTQIGSGTSWPIPVGYMLNGKSYRFVVQVWDSTGISASSSPVDITTAWTPPATLSNFSATGNNTTGDVTLTWTKSTLSFDLFGGYSIYRTNTEGASERVALIDDPNTTTFIDPFCQSGPVTYLLTQIKNLGIDKIESGSNEAMVDMHFLSMLISDTSDPYTYRVEIMDAPARSFQLIRDEVDVRYWGSSKMVRHIGTGQYTAFNVSGRLLGSSIAEDDESASVQMLTTLIKRKNVVCYRDGRGRKYFCNMALAEQDELPYTFTPTLTMVEAEYTEVVE